MIKYLTGALVATAAFGASPAAASIDAFTLFNGVNGNGGFYYGSVNGTTFTDYDAGSVGGCFLPGGTCLYSSTSSNGVIPGVVKGGSFPTVDYSGTTLAMHPSDTLATFASYQASTANIYRFQITLKSIGTDTTNGIGYRLFQGNSIGARQVLSSYKDSVVLFRGAGLTPGERFGVIVDANGGYAGDTTALTFRAFAVPEPAQWALMIGGFGVIGGAMRRRRRATFAAA